ncbi:hypothetical protein D3C85_1487070 [compost metagenome]
MLNNRPLPERVVFYKVDSIARKELVDSFWRTARCWLVGIDGLTSAVDRVFIGGECSKNEHLASGVACSDVRKAVRIALAINRTGTVCISLGRLGGYLVGREELAA